MFLNFIMWNLTFFVCQKTTPEYPIKKELTYPETVGQVCVQLAVEFDVEHIDRHCAELREIDYETAC